MNVKPPTDELPPGYTRVLLQDVVLGKEDYFLAADIGGTNARFYLFATKRRDPMMSELLYQKTFSTPQGGDTKCDIKDYIKTFFKQVRGNPGLQGITPAKVKYACFAIAGPVTQRDGAFVADLTNAEWQGINSVDVANNAQLGGVTLINDFEAAGRGVVLLKQKPNANMVRIEDTGGRVAYDVDMVTLYEPKVLKAEEKLSPLQPYSRKNPVVVLGPGTGMGEALGFPDSNGNLQVFPTEGGHSGFCPWDDATRVLQAFYETAYGFAEVETILCGKGLVRLYIFLEALYWDDRLNAVDYTRTPTPAEVREAAAACEDKLKMCDKEQYHIKPYHMTMMAEQLIEGGDVDVSRDSVESLDEKYARRLKRMNELVQEGKLHPAIVEAAVDIFLTALGSEAGSMALSSLSFGGVYICGGIMKRPGILQTLAEKNKETFLRGYFFRRPEFAAQLEEIPVYIVNNEFTPALGSLSGAVEAFVKSEVDQLWGTKPSKDAS